MIGVPADINDFAAYERVTYTFIRIAYNPLLINVVNVKNEIEQPSHLA